MEPSEGEVVSSPSNGLCMEWQIDGTAYHHVVEQPRWVESSQNNLDGRSGMPTQVSWRGLLLVDQTGHYEIALRTNGHVKLELDHVDQIVNDSNHDRRHVIFELELEQGLHLFRLTWRPGTPLTQAPLVDGLAWKGPGFGYETVPASHWSMPPNSADVLLADGGENLSRRLQCDACHGDPVRQGSAPSLEKLSSKLRPQWLVERLSQPAVRREKLAEESDSFDGRVELQAESNGTSRMPDFLLPLESAKDITAFLWHATSERTQHDKNDSDQALDEPPPTSESEEIQIEAGRDVFLTRGCLACHTYQGIGGVRDLAGGDLTHIGRKRPTNFFRKWLLNPAELQSNHQMPQFEWTTEDVGNVSRFLVATGNDSQVASTEDLSVPESWLTETVRWERGRSLFAQLRCASCHCENAILPPSRDRTPLGTDKGAWRRGCMDVTVGSAIAPTSPVDSTRQSRKRSPYFDVSSQQRDALQRFWSIGRGQVHEFPASITSWLQQKGCLACHSRGTHAGLNPVVRQVTQRYPHLAVREAMFVPPSLDHVGEKLCDHTLLAAIQGKSKVRPYLEVRMPSFRHIDDKESQQMAEAWAAEDRWVEQLDARGPFHDSRLDIAAVRPIGARLVTSNGFGCISCHEIGSVVPLLEKGRGRGPQLNGISQRVRPEWFVRWLDQPTRMVPRVEMPSVRVPVPGLLEDHLPTQIEALWRTLSDPHFQPPRPNAYQVLRQPGPSASDATTRVHVITDVTRIAAHQGLSANTTIRVPEHEYIKPFVIGLGNRHNLLMDLEHAEVAGWWPGDVAAQLVLGKTWVWEVTQPSWLTPKGLPEFRLVASGRTPPALSIEPQRQGQFVTELDRWWHEDGGVTWQHRLHFDIQHASPVVVNIQQKVVPWSDSKQGWIGWHRQVIAQNVPANWQLELRVSGSLGPQIVQTSAATHSRTNIDPTRATIFVNQGGLADGEWYRGELSTSNNTEKYAEWSLHYGAPPVADQFNMVPIPAPPRRSAERLTGIAPGFEVVRLPTHEPVLPTAFSWSPRGEMFVASLDGRIWRVSDQDGDGAEEEMTLAAATLAAPFGMHAEADYLDVIDKTGLLRCRDGDGDGFLESFQTVASGWGHTADYHDWAIGLPRSEDGGYFIATGCETNDRTNEASQWRGCVLRLVPRVSTLSNPREFHVEEVSRGHRYAMGIARRPDGALFVTDNEGDSNAFNELNHVRNGRHFGFVNFVDRNSPPVAVDAPSINIPHPWTRSVNGICFLTGSVDDAFGPLSGQLVGCEYDLQGLVRMSLQEVDGDVQGAVYPLTRQLDGQNSPLLGAVSCGVSPQGDLYVGSFRESGWGAGTNVGEILRFRWSADGLLPGIAQIAACHDGFEITWTKPVPATWAGSAMSYRVESFSREVHPRDNSARKLESIVRVVVAPGGYSVRLVLADMRPESIYAFQLMSIPEGFDLFPSEAYYTLNKVPTR